MNASDLMTAHPLAVNPTDPVWKAAEIMKYENIGGIPVVEVASNKLVGIITDRDITVRCVARQHGARCRVAEHMTPQPLRTVLATANAAEIIATMESAECRRIPVVDDLGRLIGIVAERDLATKLDTSVALPARRRIKAASPRSMASVDVLIEPAWRGEVRW
jgi:CBS domain-containing protein